VHTSLGVHLPNFLAIGTCLVIAKKVGQLVEK